MVKYILARLTKLGKRRGDAKEGIKETIDDPKAIKNNSGRDAEANERMA